MLCDWARNLGITQILFFVCFSLSSVCAPEVGPVIQLSALHLNMLLSLCLGSGFYSSTYSYIHLANISEASSPFWDSIVLLQ